MSDTALRSGLIRLAYANPDLRPALLSLIEKHAGEGDMAAVLDAEADPTSHDQNLPEHYYFGKTAEERLENIEKMLSQFASPASKDQNKPQSYYGLPPKGKQASVGRTAMDFPSEEALKQYLRDHPNADKKKHRVRKDTTYEKHHAKVESSVKDKFNDVTSHLSDAGLSEDEAFGDREMSALGQKWFSVTRVKLNDAKKSADREKLNAVEKEMNDIAGKMKARITELGKNKKGKQASVKTAGGSGAANAAYLRQSPLKNKILQAVAKHYGTSVSAIEAELTDPDAEAVFEYIGNDAGLQMQVYREFSTFSKNKHAAAKAPAKLKGKKLDDAISKAYYKHGDRVQVDIMNIGKIYAAGKAAYEGAESLEEADKALDEAMKAAIAKYRMN